MQWLERVAGGEGSRLPQEGDRLVLTLQDRVPIAPLGHHGPVEPVTLAHHLAEGHEGHLRRLADRLEHEPLPLALQPRQVLDGVRQEGVPGHEVRHGHGLGGAGRGRGRDGTRLIEQACEHHGAIHEGHEVRVVGHRPRVEGHRERQRHPVPIPPLALEGQEAAGGGGELVLDLAVHRDPHGARDPLRDPNSKGERDRSGRPDHERGALLIGEARDLLDLHSLVRPAEGRGDELAHRQAVVVVEVDAVGEARPGLHARPVAAPEGIERQAEHPPVPRRLRDVVLELPRLRPLGSEDAVEEGALHELRVLRLTREAQKLAGELQHVVGLAGLVGRVREPVGGQGEGLAPHLAIRGAARREGPRGCDPVPEELARVEIPLLPRPLVPAQSADRQGDVSVAVEPRENILAAGEGVQEGPLLHLVRELGGGGVAGHTVEPPQDIAHAALFVAVHVHPERLGGLELSVALVEVGDHRLEHLEGLGVSAEGVLVQEPGHDLVDRVVGRPHRFARLHAIEERLGVSREIPPAQGGLDLGKLGDQVGALRPQRLVARAPVHLSACGERVADEVAPHLRDRVLPLPERLPRRGKPGVEPEGVEQAVVGEGQEVLVVPLLLLEQPSFGEAYIPKGKGLQ